MPKRLTSLYLKKFGGINSKLPLLTNISVLMKIITFFIITVVLGTTACTKATDFVADNTTPTGVGSYPVSSNALTDTITKKAINGNSTDFTVNKLLVFELQFFSPSPIKEVDVYATVGTTARVQILNWAYTSQYSSIKKLDTLLINFTVPNVASGTSIKLEADVVNVNGLSLTNATNGVKIYNTATFKVK